MEQRKEQHHKEKKTAPADPDTVNVEMPQEGTLGPRRKWYLSWRELWTTRQIAKKRGKEAEVKATIREFFIYVFFIVTVHFVTIGATNRSAPFYSALMTHLFLESPFTVGNSTRVFTFDDVPTMHHFWAFLEKPLIEGLYRSSVITSEEREEETFDGLYRGPEEREKDRKVLNENKVLGVPRLRQLRVRNDSCEIPLVFIRTFNTCYAAYSSASEEKRPFGPRDSTAWRYSSSEELEGMSYMGIISNYHGGGYYQDLSIVPNETINIVASLKKNLWIDRGTRVVFLDFSVYNANINLLCVIKLLFEFPPTGGVLSSHDLISMKLLRYVEPRDYVVMGFEFLFIFFVLFFTVEEVIEIMFFKLQYIFSFWNIIDLVILMLSYMSIVYSLYKAFIARDVMEKVIENTNGFSNLEYIAFWEKQCNAVAGFLLFFVWIKILKYINVTHTTAQLNETLKRCAKDLAAFGLMFFFAIAAYAHLGHCLFGTKVKEFRGIVISMVTLLRTVAGYNIYESIQKADWFFGPIYFTAYVVFVFFILLNMFIAIIVNSYSEVKAEISVMDDDLHLTDFLKRRFKNVLEKCGIYSSYESKVKDKEKKLTYNDIREILRDCKFTDLEIEMFFAKYDITGERIVTEQDTQKMLRDMGWTDKEEEDVKTEEDSGVSVDEFEELKMRVENMEKFIDRLGKKINTVLERLEFKKRER